jgi:hypothetical protein
MTASDNLHPRYVFVRDRMQRFTALLDDRIAARGVQTFTGTDEAGTVHVTFNGLDRLVDVRIKGGLLRLGVGAVARRIKEAVGNAQKAATAGAAAADEELKARLEEIVRELQLAQFGPGSVADGTPR